MKSNLLKEEIIPKSKFPQLYSKRGFEKNRIKCMIPFDRNELAYFTDKKGNRLDIQI